MRELAKYLDGCKTVLIVSHTHPDGDALGSQLAMGLSLEALGKTIGMCNDSPIPKMYEFLPGIERISTRFDDINRYEAAIVLDCGDIQRVGCFTDQIQAIPVIINVDHHITNTFFGRYNLVKSNACASAELVYNLIKALKAPLNRDIAYSIYTAILTDTGSFRFTNTNSESLAICSEMVNLGVDPYFVAKNVYITYSLSRIKLLKMVLDSIEISDNGQLAVMTLTQGMLDMSGTKAEDIGRLINYARHIEDVRVAALIHEQKNGFGNSSGRRKFHVSLRSDDSVDVAGIAAVYGGGGHSSAAGFNILSTLKDVKNLLMNIADRL